jgi:hypothetical protein
MSGKSHANDLKFKLSLLGTTLNYSKNTMRNQKREYRRKKKFIFSYI